MLTWVVVLFSIWLAMASLSWIYHHVKDRKPRALLRLPATAIGEVKEDIVVRVHGTVAATQLLTAPLSGRECVAFELSAHVRHESDEYEPPEFRKVVAKSVEFTVTDETGQAVVAGAQFRFRDEHEADDSQLVERGPREKVVGVVESVLVVGASVSVCGHGRWVSSPGGTYRTTDRVLQMVEPLVAG